MDHYLTTYSKDYLWPATSRSGGGPVVARGAEGGHGPGATSGFKASPQELAFLQACARSTLPPDCRCGAAGGGGGGGEAAAAAGQDWTRNQVMGPLLDPRLFPARVGASPEVSTSRYDQPNAFLDQLQLKFPMLYSILQNAPTAELKQRIERDRNKTTYQVDYCEAGPGAELASLQRAADASGSIACSAPRRLPGDPCRVQPKPRAPRGAAFTRANQPAGGGGGGGGSKCDATSAAPPLGRTEYQDGVSKLGAIIMRDKLHRKH